MQVKSKIIVKILSLITILTPKTALYLKILYTCIAIFYLFMTLALFIVTIIMLGFFAGIEIAFVSANKLGIELRKKQGKQSGIILSRFTDNPAQFNGTCLIGFNIFLVAFGLILSELLNPYFKKLEIAGILRLIIEVFISTFLVLIVEFLFKAVFRVKNNTMLTTFAVVMDFFYGIFGWLSKLLVSIADWILKYIFNVNIDKQKPPFSRSDLEYYYLQTKENDEDNQELNTELFENALSLPQVKLRSCLIPRKEIVSIEVNSSIDNAVQKMIETKLSKLVVYNENIDNIVGYIHQLDIIKKPATIKSILLPIPTVPETMSATDLISRFSKDHKSIAWVVDEFGGTAGIVTMEDLLEEIFGDIRDEYDTEEFVDEQLSENEFILSGRLELDDLTEKYKLDFNGSESETLSGYIIKNHENMPKQNDRIFIDNYQFEIMNMSDTRIELVKLKILK